jgi:hypothetical protein
MDLKETIHSEAELAGLIDAYRRAVHAGEEASELILGQYPELRQPVAVTREFFAKNPRMGLELERLAVEGMAEHGFRALEARTPTDTPVFDGGLLGALENGAAEQAHPEAKPLDFDRVIHSVEDVRHLVAAYRLALHGGEAVAQKVFHAYPELQVLVERARAYSTGAEDPSLWEEAGVDALVGRGLRTLEEKGVISHDQAELGHER